MTIDQYIAESTRQLTAAGIASARLDVLVLLSDALQHDKSWVLAHGDDTLAPGPIAQLQTQIRQRCRRVPLAYIRGHQEFYGREFTVNPDVLIPRPETETLIDLAKNYIRSGHILDVGTGSGAIAVTLALELPNATITACDISPLALKVAQQNARTLQANVRFFESDLLSNASDRYHAIIANLPYVSRGWEVSPETAAEPAMALYANDNGLELINKLLAQAPHHLRTGGHLLLEADPRQHATITQSAHRFTRVSTHGFCIVLRLSDVDK